MESTLAPVFGAVLPVFGLVACGYFAGRFKLVTQASSHALNQFVYAFALPAMLFIAVYRGSLEEILSGAFLLAVILATLGTALIGFALSYYVAQAPPAESTMRALNASFANTGYLGIPLVTVAYGERAALPAALATVATNIISFALSNSIRTIRPRVSGTHSSSRWKDVSVSRFDRRTSDVISIRSL